MTEIPNPNTSVSRHPVAFLTGTSRGMDSVIALQLVQSGYDLFLLARKEQEELEDCAALCRATSACVVARLAGVSDSAACAEVFADLG